MSRLTQSGPSSLILHTLALASIQNLLKVLYLHAEYLYLRLSVNDCSGYLFSNSSPSARISVRRGIREDPMRSTVESVLLWILTYIELS
jgi:hypothetical protein